MQTIYYQTSSFIRHEGNVVDLAMYRSKLSAVSGGDWPTPEELPQPVRAQEPAPLLTLVPEESAAAQTSRRRKRQVRRLGVTLDLCVSLAILAMTVTAVVQFLRLT